MRRIETGEAEERLGQALDSPRVALQEGVVRKAAQLRAVSEMEKERKRRRDSLVAASDRDDAMRAANKAAAVAAAEAERKRRMAAVDRAAVDSDMLRATNKSAAVAAAEVGRSERIG